MFATLAILHNGHMAAAQPAARGVARPAANAGNAAAQAQAVFAQATNAGYGALCGLPAPQCATQYAAYMALVRTAATGAGKLAMLQAAARAHGHLQAQYGFVKVFANPGYTQRNGHVVRTTHTYYVRGMRVLKAVAIAALALGL